MWGMKAAGLQARRVHRDEPADRRGPGDGEPPELRQQPVRQGDLQQGLPGAPREQEQAADQPRGPGALSAGLDLQAGHRHRRPPGPEDHGHDEAADAGATCSWGPPASTTGTGAVSGPATSTAGSATRRTRSSSRSPACSGADRLAYWGTDVRLRQAHRHRPAGRGRGHRPVQPVEDRCAGPADVRRRGLPVRHRPGLRRRHADPADQRLRGPRQRRQAVPPAAGPRRSSGPTGRSCSRSSRT